MSFGDKIGVCGCCDEENPVQYSMYSNDWLCESCWESIAEYILSE